MRFVGCSDISPGFKTMSTACDSSTATLRRSPRRFKRFGSLMFSWSNNPSLCEPGIARMQPFAGSLGVSAIHAETDGVRCQPEYTLSWCHDAYLLSRGGL